MIMIGTLRAFILSRVQKERKGSYGKGEEECILLSELWA